MSAPSTPVMRDTSAGSRGAFEASSKPRQSRKNPTVRSRFETVKLVWFVPSTLKSHAILLTDCQCGSARLA